MNATVEVVCSRAKSLEPRSTRCRSSAISTRDKGVVADFGRSCLHSAVLAVRDALDSIAARDSNAANRTNTTLGQVLLAMTVTIVGRRAMTLLTMKMESVLMKSRMSWLAILLGVVASVPFVNANDEKKDSTDKPAKVEGAETKEKGEAAFKATCPVSGSDAKKENASKYRDKETYFCCEKCKAAFDAEPAKYSTKANLQLVQTKQFRQTKCPVSGSKVNKEQSIKVSGVKVGFCCEKCKGSLETASKDDQLTKIFGDAVFANSFAVKKADGEKKPKKDEDSESSK